jgi:hypothetical protein
VYDFSKLDGNDLKRLKGILRRTAPDLLEKVNPQDLDLSGEPMDAMELARSLVSKVLDEAGREQGRRPGAFGFPFMAGGDVEMPEWHDPLFAIEAPALKAARRAALEAGLTPDEADDYALLVRNLTWRTMMTRPGAKVDETRSIDPLPEHRGMLDTRVDLEIQHALRRASAILRAQRTPRLSGLNSPLKAPAGAEDLPAPVRGEDGKLARGVLKGVLAPLPESFSTAGKILGEVAEIISHAVWKRINRPKHGGEDGNHSSFLDGLAEQGLDHPALAEVVQWARDLEIVDPPKGNRPEGLTMGLLLALLAKVRTLSPDQVRAVAGSTTYAAVECMELAEKAAEGSYYPAFVEKPCRDAAGPILEQALAALPDRRPETPRERYTLYTEVSWLMNFLVPPRNARFPLPMETRLRIQEAIENRLAVDRDRKQPAGPRTLEETRDDAREAYILLIDKLFREYRKATGASLAAEVDPSMLGCALTEAGIAESARLIRAKRRTKPAKAAPAPAAPEDPETGFDR